MKSQQLTVMIYTVIIAIVTLVVFQIKWLPARLAGGIVAIWWFYEASGILLSILKVEWLKSTKIEQIPFRRIIKLIQGEDKDRDLTFLEELRKEEEEHT